MTKDSNAMESGGQAIHENESDNTKDEIDLNESRTKNAKPIELYNIESGISNNQISETVDDMYIDIADMDECKLEKNDINSETYPLNCSGYFALDWRSSFFSIEQPGGNILDIRRTFAPQPKSRILFLRFCFLIFSVAALIIDFKTSQNLWIWIGYLTSWGILFAISYQASIFICTLKPDIFLHQPENKISLSILLRFTWVIFQLATITCVLVTILYWSLLYYPGQVITFSNIANHGVITLLLILDGLIIARIPFRWRHFLVIQAVAIIYLIWTVLHSVLDIGLVRGENNEGRPLYPFLNFEENPYRASFVAILITFFLTPVIHLLLWTSSIVSFRCKFDGSRRL